MNSVFKRIVKSREFYLFIIILILIIFLGIKSEYFFKIENLRAMMLSLSVYGIIVSGLTIVFISGGFDMSVGSVLSTLGVLLGIFLVSGISIALSIILTLSIGAVIGFSMGFLVAKAGLNPFITSISYYFAFYGLSFFIGYSSKLRTGQTLPQFSPFPETFNAIASGTIFGIEYIFFYMIAIVAIFHILSTKNVFFRQNFYIGTNESAARVVGIRVDLVKIFNYTLVTIMVAVATILRASRVGGTNSGIAGPSFPLTMIAAIILGGGSLKGGTGSVLGSFFGVVIISILNNMMVLLGINPFYNTLIIGVVLLLSVMIDHLIKKRQL